MVSKCSLYAVLFCLKAPGSGDFNFPRYDCRFFSAFWWDFFFMHTTILKFFEHRFSELVHRGRGGGFTGNPNLLLRVSYTYTHNINIVKLRN